MKIFAHMQAASVLRVVFFKRETTPLKEKDL